MGEVTLNVFPRNDGTAIHLTDQSSVDPPLSIGPHRFHGFRSPSHPFLSHHPLSTSFQVEPFCIPLNMENKNL